ncbi:response regulator [Alkalihalobacillus sp. FSL R5-0424]
MKILIAEDDFRVAEIHQEFVNKLKGMDVVAKAKTASETITLLKKHTIDVLLLDVYLPDQKGSDLLPIIRKIQPNLTVIVITASTERTIFRTSTHFGVVDFLIKPITFERFKLAVKKAESRRGFLEGSNQLTQKEADQFFQYPYKLEQVFPKGIDPITLEKVKDLLKTTIQGITADEMGELLGASRTTSRRYLEYLITIEEARAELEYGVVGRPERLYYKKNQEK